MTDQTVTLPADHWDIVITQLEARSKVIWLQAMDEAEPDLWRNVATEKATILDRLIRTIEAQRAEPIASRKA